MDVPAKSERVRIFYRKEYVAGVLEAGMRHVFDVQRARRIRDALVGEGLVAPEEIVAPDLPSERDLLLVHGPEYLAEIRSPDVLARLLLLDPEFPWGDHLLDSFLYATGGTVAAARAALRDGVIGFNLGGGFHHAQADRADGFCAVADVAVAIRALRRDGLAQRVLIVDLDYHHGNGNAEIFREDESVFTFSVHAGNWCWITKRHNLDVELPSRTADAEYLAVLEAHLPRVVEEFRPDLVFYVAGSDPFRGDLLGDFDISEGGMLQRDRLVTREIRGRGIPMVVVTAGGYGPESWRIYVNYVRWLLRDGESMP